MKFLGVSAAVCVISFVLSIILFSFSGFDETQKKFEYAQGFFNGRFNGNIQVNFDDFETKDFEFEAQELNEVKLSSMASKLTLKSYDKSKIKVEAKLHKDHLRDFFKVEIKDQKLNIADTSEDDDSSIFSLFGKNKVKGSEITIYVPQNFEATYEIELAFGDIKISEIKGKRLEMEVTAGDIEIKNVTFDDFELEAAAGEIDLLNGVFGKGSVEAAAGNIELLNISSKEEFSVEAAAGDIELEMNQESPRVSIEAAAGSIDFSITKDLEANFTLKTSTTMGRLTLKEGYKSENGKYIYGNGVGLVTIETAFGDVEIK